MINSWRINLPGRVLQQGKVDDPGSYLLVLCCSNLYNRLCCPGMGRLPHLDDGVLVGGCSFRGNHIGCPLVDGRLTMGQIIVPCPACGKDCFADNGLTGYTFFCRPCSQEIHDLFGGYKVKDTGDNRKGDGFPDLWKEKIDTVIARHAATHVQPVKSDQPCRQCKRNCTPGDAKCWFCECPNPC